MVNLIYMSWDEKKNAIQGLHEQCYTKTPISGPMTLILLLFVVKFSHNSLHSFQ